MATKGPRPSKENCTLCNKRCQYVHTTALQTKSRLTARPVLTTFQESAAFPPSSVGVLFAPAPPQEGALPPPPPGRGEGGGDASGRRRVGAGRRRGSSAEVRPMRPSGGLEGSFRWPMKPSSGLQGPVWWPMRPSSGLQGLLRWPMRPSSGLQGRFGGRRKRPQI